MIPSAWMIAARFDLVTVHGRRRLPVAAAAALAGAFVLLAAAVAAGWLTPLDQWAVDHTMPWHGESGGPHFATLNTAFPAFHWHFQDPHVAGRLIAYLVTWPASMAPAVILAALGLLLLWQRGRRREALAWGFAFAAGNGIEILCKAVMTRPALYFHSDGFANHINSYDASFPSGHTLRAVLVAFISAAIARRLLPLLLLWAAGVAALLDLGTHHVPTDIAGSVLVAAALVWLVTGYAPAARTTATRLGS